jgi:hypothetical protein
MVHYFAPVLLRLVESKRVEILSRKVFGTENSDTKMGVKTAR